MNKNNPIVVFDSGVGSYSIVRVLQKELPLESIIYLADRASFPYGGKTHKELREIIYKTIQWFEQRYSPKVIVIASNTPSIQVLSEITPHISTKLIGVFPPIENAVSVSKTKHIAILATKGAVNSNEINEFIKSKRLPANIKILKVNASRLVDLVEPGIFQIDSKKTIATINSVINPILKDNIDIDTMTLSSTHLPFLRDYFEKLYPNINFLDPAEMVVNEVKKYLNKKSLFSPKSGKLTILSTLDRERKFSLENLKGIFQNLGLRTKIKEIAIDN